MEQTPMHHALDEKAIIAEIDDALERLPAPPQLPPMAAEETRGAAVLECQDCGEKGTYAGWEWCGRMCPECGSRRGAIRL